jgi:phage tail tape-measure protein
MTRMALPNAACVASLMLTTEAMVCESANEDAPAGGTGDMGMSGTAGTNKPGFVKKPGGRPRIFGLQPKGPQRASVVALF